MKRRFHIYLFFAAALFISCTSNPTGLDAYAETLYEPAYASGFEIVGAEVLADNDRELYYYQRLE